MSTSLEDWGQKKRSYQFKEQGQKEREGILNSRVTIELTHKSKEKHLLPPYTCRSESECNSVTGV